MDLPSDVADKKQLVKEFIDLEELNARQAKSRAVVLEILGDIPDADVAPPKNVLFVCKLNPVTEEGDLKLIFSRFGNVTSCDVIRDYKTGDSLQYAFVEFESEDACNEAYFRMQNVLIDDRRIHVDFCQSVSGFWKRFKEKGNFTRKGKSATTGYRGGGDGYRRHDYNRGGQRYIGDRTERRDASHRYRPSRARNSSPSGSPHHYRSKHHRDHSRDHRDRREERRSRHRYSRKSRSHSYSQERKRRHHRSRSRH